MRICVCTCARFGICRNSLVVVLLRCSAEELEMIYPTGSAHIAIVPAASLRAIQILHAWLMPSESEETYLRLRLVTLFPFNCRGNPDPSLDTWVFSCCSWVR